jgi:CHAT domain-containing protein
LLVGKDATEEAFMSIEKPLFMHIATHGFFLKDQDLSDLVKENRGIKLIHPEQETLATYLHPFQYQYPLLRAGLAFAGANVRSEDGSHIGGIVTAEKILNLQLRGTKLVTLSACETGVGRIEAGEGVVGLRRAFIQAGAKSLVMSMWVVPDEETKELMTNFYTNFLHNELNKPDALRHAILQQIQITKKRYGFPHPFYWGAFIFHGDYWYNGKW